MEKKKVEKVIKGNAKTIKKSDPSKGSFISDDLKNVGSFVVKDVLIPTLKDLVSDVVTNGIDMLLFGESRSSRKKSRTTDRVSYTRYYDDRDDRYRSERRSTSSRYSYDDIILDSYVEVKDVLSGMEDILDTYGVVSVADLYDLVGLTGSYTDNDYGWFNLRSAEPVRCRDGYMLKLPKVISIK